jgi:hypothetical protein
MVLSFECGYILYGMAKTGSTTLHYLLGNRSDSDIVLAGFDHGKHVDRKAVYRDLHALFAKYPYEQFIKLGLFVTHLNCSYPGIASGPMRNWQIPIIWVIIYGWKGVPSKSLWPSANRLFIRVIVAIRLRRTD